jgi:hypothetical protein
VDTTAEAASDQGKLIRGHRIGQVETLLKTQETPTRDTQTQPSFSSPVGPQPTAPAPQIDPALQAANSTPFALPDAFNVPGNTVPTNGASGETPFPWEMIGLGLDEPLPTQDVIDEL